jgi:myo-inositol 2-dehydrogenase/D-chiro-inositol 1-dehydrogenase
MGKDIFCEKPISSDIEQIKIALNEVKKANVKLQIGFNRRFDPNFAKIKQMVQNQEIGVPHILRITSRDPEIPPRSYIHASSGMFLDMTIHDFDMARFLLNSEIEEIYASGNVLIDPIFNTINDLDTAIVNLKFANGALGVIDNSRQAVYGYDQRVEVFGNGGAVHAENNRQTNTVLSNQHGIVSEKPLYFFLERYKESYIAEMQAFYNTIAHNKPIAVTGYDGLMSVVIGTAANKSYRENCPVKINHEEWSEFA